MTMLLACNLFLREKKGERERERERERVRDGVRERDRERERERERERDQFENLTIQSKLHFLRFTIFIFS